MLNSTLLFSTALFNIEALKIGVIISGNKDKIVIFKTIPPNQLFQLTHHPSL
jgi:hypothetical protein